MSDELLRKHKLTDALPEQQTSNAGDAAEASGTTHETDAEQKRQAQESSNARDAQGGVRDRLVDIGKAHHMAGRGSGRVGDS